MPKTAIQQINPLTITLIIALLFGAYFLRPYFSLIILAAIMAYTFNPLYKRLARKLKKPSSAASLTLLASILVLLLPLALIVTLSVFQVRGLIDSYSAAHIDVGKLGRDSLDWLNDNILSKAPGSPQLTLNQIQEYTNKAVSAIGSWFLSVLSSSISSIAGFFASVILYIYVFLNLLTHQDKIISTIKRLNPLGEKASDNYLKKMGAMTGAMVRGHFIIAFLQGLTSAIFLYIAGLHNIFFFMLVVLTLLSVIPLGAGIITIPIGAVMILFGNVWQGALILLGHLLVVTNIDNFLRPILVPKHVRLNAALTLLSVFAGISMFGFLGIIIGPVIMILITTTIEMYLDHKDQTT